MQRVVTIIMNILFHSCFFFSDNQVVITLDDCGDIPCAELIAQLAANFSESIGIDIEVEGKISCT